MQIEALKAEFRQKRENLRRRARLIQFDDLETFEQTKCKPLSVTLAVEEGTRRILGVEVSQMPAKGKLAQRSRELYGERRDERARGRRSLFRKIGPLVHEDVIVKSDENPHYQKSLEKHLPSAKHVAYRSRRARPNGLGELKKGGFDPLFSLNHTCAMLRANINRLFRKTWCTTKKAERLYAHLALYIDYHNRRLIPATP